MAALADTPTIRFVIDEIAHTLVEMSAQPAQEQLPEVMVSFDDWASGVEDLQNKTPAELWDMLGLPGKALPGFNTVEDPNGVVDPWSEEWKGFVASRKGVPFGPRWHQLVGMVKLMRHVIRGRPLLLMDEVGVGKTMQIVGMLSLYPVYRQFWLKEGHFPGAFGTLSVFLKLTSFNQCPQRTYCARKVVATCPTCRTLSSYRRHFSNSGRTSSGGTCSTAGST